jgi:hypothetical protein
VPKTFRHILEVDPLVATAVAAIKTLIEVLKNCPSTTLAVSGFRFSFSKSTEQSISIIY